MFWTGLLPEVVVDPEDRVSGKTSCSDRVQLPGGLRGRGRTASRRSTRASFGAAGAREVLRRPSGTCWAGWRGSAAGRCGLPSSLAQLLERRGVGVVAVDVPELAAELRERLLSTPPPCSLTLACAPLERADRDSSRTSRPPRPGNRAAASSPWPASAGKIFLYARSPVAPKKRARRSGACSLDIAILLQRARRSRSASRTAPCSGRGRGRATRSVRRARRVSTWAGTPSVVRRRQCPAAFARIGDAAGEPIEVRVVGQGLGGQVEQPGA